MALIKKLFFLSVLLITSLCFSQKKLALNLNVGDTYHHHQNSYGKIVQTYETDTIIMNLNLGGESEYKVIEKNKNSFKIEARFTAIYMELISDYASIVMDSKSEDETDVFSKVFKGMMNVPFYFTLNKNGTVSNMKVNHLFKNLFVEFPEITEAQKNEILTQIKKSYGEKAFKGSVEMVTAIFPDKKVKLFEEWNNTVQLESGFKTQLYNTFTLKEYNKEYAIITINSKTINDDDSEFIPTKGTLMKYNLPGTMKGEIKIDSKTGWVISTKLYQNFEGVIEKKWFEASKLTQKIPMSFNTIMEISGGELNKNN